MRGKSILRKQMLLYMGILLFSFAMLAATLSLVLTGYYVNEKEEQLVKQGRKVAEQYVKSFYTGIDGLQKLNNEIQVLEDYMEASVFFVNKDGELILASQGISQSWVGQTITNEAIEGVLEGKIVSVEGKINGMFVESVLTVGYPIQLGEQNIGGIFMCSSMPEIEKNISQMYKACFACVVIAMFFGSILVYFSSRKISKPLMEINEAAKVIAGGNFDRRISIRENDEIGQLAKSFNNMAESLYTHEKDRREFIANISHDLRSPLTSIQGFLNAILDGTIPKESQEHYLNIVLEETQRLTKLTNNIVDLSSAQEGKIILDKSEFDINELIRDSLEKIQPRFMEKEIKADLLLAEKETLIDADRDKIVRVLQNLLDNALKFTDRGGSIEVETTIEESGKKVYIAVRDNGKGISEEDQKHIFDRFFKADTSRGEDKKGGGLGLSIAKEFIKAHGENIICKSNLGEGTEFVFSLPLVKRAGSEKG